MEIDVKLAQIKAGCDVEVREFMRSVEEHLREVSPSKGVPGFAASAVPVVNFHVEDADGYKDMLRSTAEIANAFLRLQMSTIRYDGLKAMLNTLRNLQNGWKAGWGKRNLPTLLIATMSKFVTMYEKRVHASLLCGANRF